MAASMPRDDRCAAMQIVDHPINPQAHQSNLAWNR